LYGRGVEKPASNIKGITHHVRSAPPVRIRSVIFIAASMEIIETMDMPVAVFNALLRSICRLKIIVSRIIEVIKPFIIAKLMISRTGQSMLDNWKKAIVPKSPMLQPSTHHAVFFEDIFHVCRHRQFIFNLLAIVIILISFQHISKLSIYRRVKREI
jgi:hypothetical protein